MFHFNYIPLRHKSKVPCIKSWEQYQTERVTETLKSAWEQLYPNCNWGIVTGNVSGIIVLDIDGDAGFESLKQRNIDISEIYTPTVKTGKGMHLYFKHPGGTVNNRVNIIPHVDIRGDGGYVVAPPSIHSNGKNYEWIRHPDTYPIIDMPQWLCDLMDNKHSEHNNDDDWVVEALSGASEGKRNDTATRLAGYFFAKGMSRDHIISILTTWNSLNTPPLPESELETIVNSVGKAESRKRTQFVTNKGNPILENIVPYLAGKLQFKITTNTARGNNDNTQLYIYNNGIYDANVTGLLGNWLYEHVGSKAASESANVRKIRDGIINSVNIKDRISLSDLQFYEKRKVNLQNGVLDIDSGELLPHSPEHVFLGKLPIEYDPEAECPTWKHFLSTTLEPEHIPTLQEYMGLSLVPDTRFQKALLLYGTGANGKSIVINTIMHILGQDYTSTVTLNDLQNNRFAASQLVGKLLNVSSETVNYTGAELDKFKAIVGGDPVSIERKGIDGDTATLCARLLFASNTFPRSGDQTIGGYRRWIIIPFDKYFSPKDADTRLQDKLDKELPGILNWCLEGLKRLYENDEFSFIDQGLIDQMIYDNDNVVRFLEECCIITNNDDDTIPTSTLYRKYADWTSLENSKPVGKTEFGRRLARKFDRGRTSSTRFYIGLKFGDFDLSF